jgi:hypothetical protein
MRHAIATTIVLMLAGATPVFAASMEQRCADGQVLKVGTGNASGKCQVKYTSTGSPYTECTDDKGNRAAGGCNMGCAVSEGSGSCSKQILRLRNLPTNPLVPK